MKRREIDPRRYLALTALLAAVATIAICLLPHDRRLRFEALTDWDVVKAGWIYDRIHNDPTPIDVAFIGTSRTVFGVDSAEVETLARQATEEDLHVVNFGMPFPGRDLHWLLVRELLEARKVRLLVIEADEDEPRDLHRAFGSLADPRDLLQSPLILNETYFPNLVRLPRRQLSLFLRSTFAGIFGASTAFDPASYRGAHWDDMSEEDGTPQSPIHPIHLRTASSSAEEMSRERTHEAQVEAHKIHLPRPLAWLEERANVEYLYKIAALAREHGTALTFLYLPEYQGLARPAQAALYEQLGPLWIPPGPLSNRKLWFDVNHLNYYGAVSLAPWLAAKLSDTEKDPPDADNRPVAVSSDLDQQKAVQKGK